MGMFFGPEGALAGAGLGVLYGERGHLLQDAKDVGHVGSTIGHDLKSGWDDFFGGGQHATPTASAGKLNVNVTVRNYMDGKEITKAVTKRVKHTATLSLCLRFRRSDSSRYGCRVDEREPDSCGSGAQPGGVWGPMLDYPSPTRRNALLRPRVNQSPLYSGAQVCGECVRGWCSPASIVAATEAWWAGLQ